MRFAIFFLLLALPVIAGPVGNFRLENGGVVKGEVMNVDENYYYCRKVSDPSIEFTVKVENVPLSFRRLVNQLRMRGEITEPKVKIAPIEVDDGFGDWTFTDYQKQGNAESVKAAETSTKDNLGRDTRLVVRLRDTELEIFLMFEDQVTMIQKWQITYSLDGGEERTVLWANSEDRKTLFSSTPFGFRDQLLESDTLSIRLVDKQGAERQLHFNVAKFDVVLAQFSK